MTKKTCGVEMVRYSPTQVVANTPGVWLGFIAYNLWSEDYQHFDDADDADDDDNDYADTVDKRNMKQVWNMFFLVWLSGHSTPQASTLWSVLCGVYLDDYRICCDNKQRCQHLSHQNDDNCSRDDNNTRCIVRIWESAFYCE